MPGQLIEMQDVSAELLRELSPQLDQDHIRRVTTAIERLGYGLVRADGVDEGTRGQDVLARIRQPEAKVSDLLPLWQERNAEMPEWKQPETYALLAKRFIDLGVPYTAQEVAEAGLSFATPQDRLQLRHLKGLALARSGQVDAASQVLCDKELAELPRDEELRGLEAALQKQLVCRSKLLRNAAGIGISISACRATSTARRGKLTTVRFGRGSMSPRCICCWVSATKPRKSHGKSPPSASAKMT